MPLCRSAWVRVQMGHGEISGRKRKPDRARGPDVALLSLIQQMPGGTSRVYLHLPPLFSYTDLVTTRKFFRKYLPSHETVRQNRFVALFGDRLQHHNLWHLHRRSVAGGVAAGLFAGLIPGSNPVQFFFGALFAIVFKVNLPVAVITTLYSNPFTILPIYMAAYAVGSFVTGEGITSLPTTDLHLMDKSVGEWIPALADWAASLGKPLLVGLVLLALLLSTVGYFAVRAAWRLYAIYEWRKRARKRAEQS